MKSFTSTVLVISVLAGPSFSFAHGPDDPAPPERHRHERVKLKDTGYEAAAGDVGGVTSKSDSGGRPMKAPAPSTCVGPVSYCDLFFGS